LYISDLDLIKQKLTIEGKLNQSEIIKLIFNDAETNKALKEQLSTRDKDIADLKKSNSILAC
jgi:hypothetical protein